MKGRIVGLVMGFVFVGWGVPQAPAFFSTQAVPLKVSIALPAASLDLSDLDARDQFNHPVRSDEKRQELATLFSSGLNSILMQNLTPTARAEREILSRIWEIGSGVLKTAVRHTVEFFNGNIPQKRFYFSPSRSGLTVVKNHDFHRAFLWRFDNAHQTNLSSILSSTILLR